MPKPLWVMADETSVDEVIAAMFGFENTKNNRTYGPYGLIGSSRINKSMYDPLMMAHYLAGEIFKITQGGLNNSAVVASAKTHNGLGVADTARAGIHMTMADAFRVVAFGMECGVLGFIRGVAGHDNMVDHIHWAEIGAESVMHPSTFQQLYNAKYGAFHGGAGLGGAPRARWYGPPMKGVTTWEKSKYNPKNGWKP